jgi:hypothetical protein
MISVAFRNQKSGRGEPHRLYQRREKGKRSKDSPNERPTSPQSGAPGQQMRRVWGMMQSARARDMKPLQRAQLSLEQGRQRAAFMSSKAA